MVNYFTASHLEVENFLCFPITTNEEDLRENIEEELGEEPEGDDWEEYEERVEEELGTRGDFYPVSELIEAVKLYKFQGNTIHNEFPQLKILNKCYFGANIEL